jgi:hypothetical protein
MKIIKKEFPRLTPKTKIIEPSELYWEAHQELIKYMHHNRIEAFICPTTMETI